MSPSPEKSPESEKPYLSPSEVARFDPYGVRKQALEEEAQSLESQAPPPSPDQPTERADITEAAEIMGEDFYGPAEIRVAFGVELAEDEIPPQPFTRAELEHYRQEGFFLVLRTDHDAEGNPLTIQRLKELYQVDPKDPNQRIFYQQDWYEKPENADPFFTSQTPQTQWALVKKEILPDSTSKQYQAQEQFFQTYAQQQAPHLEQGHQIQRREAVDQAYDLILAYLSRGQRLLPDRYDWSKTQLKQGAYAGPFAALGYFDAKGFDVDADFPSVSDDDLGVCPSVVSEIEI